MALAKRKPRAVAKQKIDKDAVEIGKLYKHVRLNLIASVRCSIECGQRLAAKKATLKHGEWLPWLEANRASLGFGESAAKMMMRTAANRQPAADLDDDEALEISREMWGHEEATASFRRRANEPDTDEECDAIEAARWGGTREERAARAEKRAQEERAREERVKAYLATKRSISQELRDEMARKIIEAGFKALAKNLHPDKGGENDEMAALYEARDLLKGRLR